VFVHDEIERQFGIAIPMVTIEPFEFFRRAEIKDALACVRLLTHPHDTGAMRRIRIPGLGDTSLKAILGACEPVGLRLSDFASEAVLRDGDPFKPLLDAWHEGDIVVFDTETTGLDPATDEIVEIAAQRLHRGQPVADFHRYIQVVDVGDSVRIHGITNTDLAIVGEPARAVLVDFLHFARGAHLVGHNVYFDLKMVMSHARRMGIDVPDLEATDTYDMARRFVPSENYRLETLTKTLGLPSPPTHRADADAQTTVELLRRLIALAREQALQRAAVTGRYARMFAPLAGKMAAWRSLAARARPADLLRRVLNDTDVLAAYPTQERARRAQNLERLVAVFAAKDDPTLHPDTSLRALLDYTAMARNADQLAQAEDRVMVCTVHQAKGLEFDHVFIAGAVDGEFPSFLSAQDGDPARLEEERRLFYVAMTRARKRLFITRHAVNRWNYQRAPSPYLRLIDRAYCEEV
jgi:DNA helicase-2/ATP-dependent DNA helicase PcrA